jgi:hypothetical protein
MFHKGKGQRSNRGPIETLAVVFLGPTRRYALVWTGGVVGSNSPRPYQEKNPPRKWLEPLTENVIGYEPKTGLETHRHFGSMARRKQGSK